MLSLPAKPGLSTTVSVPEKSVSCAEAVRATSVVPSIAAHPSSRIARARRTLSLRRRLRSPR